MHNNRGITMLALVITIVILLLLAAVTIQLTLGNDGIIAKSTDARIKQAKTELIDTARVEYSTLNMRATANDKEPPTPEMVLEQQGFLSRYNIVGENITDKNGNVIAAKEEVLNSLRRNSITSPSSTAETQEQQTPVAEEDKDKMILKLRVTAEEKDIYFGAMGDTKTYYPIKIDYGNGTTDNILDFNGGKKVKYPRGEYIIKVEEPEYFTMGGRIKQLLGEGAEVEIVKWGKIREKNEENYIQIDNVSKIHEPEPDKIPVIYRNAKFSTMPEWLYSKKVTSKVMSKIRYNANLTEIPKDIFKNCVNAENFAESFLGCTNIQQIPEELFKYNTKAKIFKAIFYECSKITEIPKDLFRYNEDVRKIEGSFASCTAIMEIPEELFKYNTKLESVNWTFSGCVGITEIPENLFKYNGNIRDFSITFRGCHNITTVPKDLFKNNIHARYFTYTFENCVNLTTIPEELFKYNVNTEKFAYTFLRCTKLRNIPDRLISYNIRVKDVSQMFNGCKELQVIPNEILDCVNKVEQRGGVIKEIFKNCTAASNYNSLPQDMR